MITTCLSIAGATITILYKTGIEEERARLMETAQSQARLIESMARFDGIYSRDYPGGARLATLSQIIDAHEHYDGFGETGEFTLSEKVEKNIVFLLRHRHSGRSTPKPIPFESELAEPMRRALSGRSGTVVGLDYRGEKVLAAHEPVAELNLGIVAKIDMSEVRAPFLKAGLIVMLITVLVVLIGVGLFLRITNPMVIHLERKNQEMIKLSGEMKGEIHERKLAEAALRKSDRELNIRNQISEIFLTISDDDMYGKVLNVVLEAMKSKYGTFAYIDEDGTRVVPSMTRDIWDKCKMPEKDIVFPRDTWGDNIWARCLIEKKSISSNGPFQVPNGHIPITRTLAVPIVHQKEAIGNFLVGNKLSDYNEKDIQLMETIADYIAPVLKARLERNSQERKRKQAEEALQKSHDELEWRVKERTAELTKTNQQLSLIYDSVADVLFYIRVEPDDCFRFLSINHTFLKATGLTRDQIVGKRIEEVIPETSGRLVLDNYKKAIKENRIVRWEETSVYPAGEKIGNVSVAPILNKKGICTHLVGSVHDVTERRQAEDALRKSEENYRLLIKTLPSIVYIGHKDWSIELFDDKIESITGHGADEFNSRKIKWSDVIHEEDLETAKESFLKAIKTDRSYVREYRIKSKSGDIRWIQDRGYIVCDRQGEIKYANGVLFDISDVKRKDDALKKNEMLLQAVFDGISDPLFLLDENLQIKILNNSASRYYQKKKKSVINKCCYQAFRGKSEPCEGCRVPAAIKSRQNLSFERSSIKDPNRLEQVVIYQFDDRNTPFGGAILRIHDITDAKLMERQIIHNEKLASLGLMVSCIAHEVTNPLSAITFNAPILNDYIDAMFSIVDDYAKDFKDFELFKMTYPQFRKDVGKIMENILHASQRIHTLVSDLRKVHGDKKQQNRSWFDLKQIIERIIAQVGVEINQYVKFFEVNIPENLPEIYIDPDATEQILTNLLINAVHAADKEDSKIKLDVAVGKTWEDHLIIEVSDNGCGMDEETQSKIFNPFFSTKESGKGSGLGLYVCHDLVQEHDGRIEVESEAGKGSVFRVVLSDFDRRSAKRL
jgi:PAS domain S-box-containing protein